MHGKKHSPGEEAYRVVPARIEGGGRAVVSQAGSVLLAETVRKVGLDTAISAALAPWRKARAVHDPGKILLDVALAVALGGDCLADVAMLRCEPAVFGPVASDPTVSRLIDNLAASGEKALQAIRSARSEVRDRIWSLAGENAPDADGQVTVDLDGVLVIAHSDKEGAAATWKKTYGHHPLTAFVDHGAGGTGEPVAVLLRPGNAGSNTAADHITTARLALAQLPKKYGRGRQTLVRTDSAGGTYDFVSWLAKRGRWLSYSVGMTITEVIHEHVLKIPAPAWTAAVETNLAWMSSDLGQIRNADTQGRTAWLCAELAGHNDLRAWVLSTRSKVAFWDGRLREAVNFARRGATYTTTGTVAVLLACQEADAWSQLGAYDEALAALSRAEEIRAAVSGEDEIGGIFACQPARQVNYAAAVQLRIGRPADALRSAEDALALLTGQPVRAYGTESQIRISQAAAHLATGEAEGAIEALGPVLALSPDHRLAPVARRLNELRTGTGRPEVSGTVAGLQQAIEEFCVNSAPRHLALSPGEGAA
ncbi:IS1380 family transposase [Streptomyces sp. NPDC052701]|uniref:IS1380 family transposase n=1 Tax=Streptomyces sp. NPDC052701 TaxID=3155533 RepID=UPI00342B73E9